MTAPARYEREDMHAIHTTQRRALIANEVLTERRGQIGLYDDARHTPEVWIAKLAKHLGRAVTNDPVQFRRSMVIVAALAVAAVEWIDERYGR